MQKLKLLGQSANQLPQEPNLDTLEVFDNVKPERDYVVRLKNKDFSSLCPVTGQPDFAEIKISYIPNKYCVETKSLKFYLASFRNQKSFNEKIANRIFDDLLTALEPRMLRVKFNFASRGGIQLSVILQHPKK